MQVRDLVRFGKERYFNGAVQTEWFYDYDRVKAVSESYVYHGPKYFGVSSSDVNLGGHKLIDTASFALNIAEKLNTESPDNSFVLTIAGYGAGKSHLAVSMASLFSLKEGISDIVISNIEKADNGIAKKISEINKKKNFVIVLNGMNNFNLDAEILKCTRLTLAQNGLEDDILRNLTKSYDIARQFVEKTFDMCQTQFETEAHRRGIHSKEQKLKRFIIENIESDNGVIELVNSVYHSITGDTIRWDRGLSAGDIISEVFTELCGEGKPFNKVLVLFDEFGRYIEYAAANPAIAGEAALQQIFESVQSANGGIIFTGFVQSELDAYLARIEKTSNIMRYVGRYKTSENLFLSSNFETILANVIEKVDEKSYERILNSAFSRYDSFHSRIKSSLLRWDRSTTKKSVWTNDFLYKSVIMKGCYPLHPITVWLLANMNNWMQQRSAITFVAEMVDRISNADVEGTWLPYVYPINIIDSSIYNEMLNSEEKGLVQSQYCMLYRDIKVKIGDKLSDNELKALKAILIVNVGRFSFYNKEDVLAALRYCSNLKEEELAEAIKKLENNHGVVSFDENSSSFDLIAEANGFNEFKRVFSKYRMFAKPATIEDCDDSIRKELSLLADIETAFAQQHHISSLEWRFKKTLLDSTDITESLLISKLRELNSDYSGDGCRGEILFAYCPEKSGVEISRLAEICKKIKISQCPLIIIFLDDPEGEILNALKIKQVLNRFSYADHERFKNHISSQHKAQDKKIIKRFNTLVQNRNCISEEGLIQYQGRLNNLCTRRFEKVFDHAMSFMFDGFESKKPAAARRYLSTICIKLFDRSLLNIQSYNALSTDEKNRIKSCLMVGNSTSWQVFCGSCSLTKPKDACALSVFDLVENKLDEGENLSFIQIFGDYLKAPYGMNMNALALFFFYYIAFKDKYIHCYYGNEKLLAQHVSGTIFKGNRLQIKELLKIRVEKNINVDKDLVRELCEEILSCTSIEKCQSYKKQLNDLLVQEGTTPENQLLVASAFSRLDEGIELYNDLYNKISKGQEIIEEAKKGFNIQKFVRVFKCYVNTNGPIAPPLPFLYSDTYISQMSDLKNSADLLLKKYGTAAINRFTCKLTQLSQFKPMCKNMAIVFRNNGYEEYAQLVEAHAIEVEENLLARQKYEASLVELDKDIAMITDISQLGYLSCAKALEKMKGWKVFFNQVSDMPLALLNAQKEKLTKSIEAIMNRMKQISTACHDCIYEIKTTTSFEEMCQIEEKLNSILSLGLNDEDNKDANECLRLISAAKNLIENLPDNIDELEQTKDTLDVLAYGVCEHFIISTIEQKLEGLYKRQENWIERFITPVMNESDRMNAVDCSNWIDRTKTIPVFLSKDALYQYKVAKEVVEKQLHKSRVQGVYVMYDKLSDSEKREFMRLIMP